jgi:hypothetical protein
MQELMLKNIRSIARSVPVFHKLARRMKTSLSEAIGEFYTLSPDVLVALVKAFNIQNAKLLKGHNLFEGHGYYEFGLFRGFSFWFAEQMSREYAGSSFRLFGFDSFQGLPPPQLDVEASVFRKGDFCGSYETVTTNLKKWKTDLSRISLHQGFYSNALFERLRQSERFLPVSICLIDVDLYESCVPVLDFVKDFLVEGSILLFDDYNQFAENDQDNSSVERRALIEFERKNPGFRKECGENGQGERKALIEFERKNPGFRKEHLFDYGSEGVAFRVLSVGD